MDAVFEFLDPFRALRLILPALALMVGWQVLKVLWVLTVALVRLTADVCGEVAGWHADRRAVRQDPRPPGRPLGMDKPFNWPPRR